MSDVATKLGYLNSTKAAIKEALINKGVEVADTDTFRSYADKIGSIESSGTEKSAGIVIDVGSTIDDAGTLTAVGASSLTIYATDVGEDALNGTWEGSSLTTVAFPTLTSITGKQALYHTFSKCASLTSVSFPSLTTVSAYNAMRGVVQYCTALYSLEFPSLTTISEGYAMYGICYGATNVTSLDLPNLSGSLYYCALGANNTVKKIWIPKEVTKIVAATTPDSTEYSYSYSPFYNCDSSLVIYTDATEKLDGWSDYCFNISATATATVVYGATHEDFEGA